MSELKVVDEDDAVGGKAQQDGEPETSKHL